MILDDIIKQKRKAIDEKKNRYPLTKILKKLETLTGRRREFKKVLSVTPGINVIAEIKQASPSKGIICEEFDPLRIAQIYEFSDACAISIVTEKDYFKGKLSFLKTVREVTARPLLRKDFIIDKYQLYETALLNADAVLLIASILSVEEIRDYIAILKEFEIDALVEIHTDVQLAKALDAGAEIVGINNRDLYTFNVDLETTFQLIRNIPKDVIVVAESGIQTHEDIQHLRSVGVNAFLIGETLLRSTNMIKKMNELRGVGWK